jgi:putative ABC transport system permease protein
MRKLRALWMRLIRARRTCREYEAELESHIAMHTEAGVRAGLSEQAARRQALIRVGGAEQARQAYRERAGLPMLETLMQDARYALRGFRRNPVFALTAIVTLALGIGATTAVFSVVDRILFRPLPYADPGRIVSVGLVHSLERQEFLMGPFYLAWRENQRSFSAIGIQSTFAHDCDLVEQNPAQLNCIAFNAGFLPLFGISPILGRNFLPEEDRPNGPPVVMISYGLWKGHYNGDPHILERTIDVDGDARRVVGVLPGDFQFPTLETAEIVFPMAFDPAIQKTTNLGFGTPMRAFARLRPGVNVAQARAEMQPMFESELRVFPAEARKEVRLNIRSLRDRETEDAQPVAWVLLGFVLAVLLIACANVASLMTARGAARQREIAVRAAIGASRGRLIRQAMTEALLLACAGGAAGLATARGLLTVFVRLAPTGIPFIGKAHLDLRIAAFAALLTCICGVIFGLVPALEKPGLEALNAKASMSRSHAFLRRSLVTAQIAATTVLLTGAALLLRSFAKIEAQNLGIETGGVLTMKVALPWSHYNNSEKVMQFYLQLESALRRLLGTLAVAISDSMPPGGSLGFRYSDLVVEGKAPTPAGTGGSVVGRFVTPDYFRALNIPIIRGRSFSEQDRTGNEREVILSRLLAARLFPGEDPIGKRFEPDKHHGGAGSIVVGMADNVKNNGLTEQSDPEMYTLRRNVADDWSGNRLIVVMDSVMPARAVESWVRAEVASIDPTVPVEMEALDQTVSRMADRPRFETALLSFFALTGLAMAVIGLYGVIAYRASMRTQEIGVRMALGADRLAVLRLILGEGMRLAMLGVAMGLGSALALARVLKSLLFGVGPHDPATFAAVALLLVAVSALATLLPARRAASIQPMDALRAE